MEESLIVDIFGDTSFRKSLDIFAIYLLPQCLLPGLVYFWRYLSSHFRHNKCIHVYPIKSGKKQYRFIFHLQL